MHAEKIRGKDPNATTFARSAFNRYYYAVYLLSRQLLVDTLGTRSIQHKALPEFLSGKFHRTMKSKIEKGYRSGLLTSTARGRMRTILTDNITLLSELLRQAYGIRVLADYDPDAKVEGADFVLGSSTLPAASMWERRADMHCKHLYRVWKDLGH
jgi:hypothetical protein